MKNSVPTITEKHFYIKKKKKNDISGYCMLCFSQVSLFCLFFSKFQKGCETFAEKCDRNDTTNGARDEKRSAVNLSPVRG